MHTTENYLHAFKGNSVDHPKPIPLSRKIQRVFSQAIKVTLDIQRSPLAAEISRAQRLDQFESPVTKVFLKQLKSRQTKAT